MLKKLKSKAGLTLTELLVTMLILTLFSSACLVGITSAFAARRDHILIADAYILKASVTEVITQELRLATKIEVNEDFIDYNGGLSINGGSKDRARLGLKNNKGEYTGRIGKTIYGSGSSEDYFYWIMNESAYGDFKITDLKFELLPDKTNITSIRVTFKIKDENGLEITDADFYVVPINKKP